MIVNARNQASHMTVRRTKKLPFPGQVLVNQGEKVSHEAIIAQGQLPGGIVFLDVAQGLRLSADEVPACLTRKIGDLVQADDVIASCEGTFLRVIRSSVSGQLVECHQGKVVMTTEAISTDIKAGMPGVVEKIIPEFGAVIATWGCLIQGVWGNNRMATGVLQTLNSSPERPLQLLDLELVNNGHVILTEVCPKVEVLEGMIARGISGLIVNSCSPAMIPNFEKVEVPVVILQGNGIKNPDGFTMGIFSSHQGKVVTVDAQRSDEFYGRCPEVIIPQEKGDFIEDAPLRGELSIGQEVRIFSGPAAGQTGIITDITDEPQIFPSGMSDMAALVYLESDEEVLVPSKNLLILNRGVHQG